MAHNCKSYYKTSYLEWGKLKSVYFPVPVYLEVGEFTEFKKIFWELEAKHHKLSDQVKALTKMGTEWKSFQNISYYLSSSIPIYDKKWLKDPENKPELKYYLPRMAGIRAERWIPYYVVVNGKRMGTTGSAVFVYGDDIRYQIEASETPGGSLLLTYKGETIKEFGVSMYSLKYSDNQSEAKLMGLLYDLLYQSMEDEIRFHSMERKMEALLSNERIEPEIPFLGFKGHKFNHIWGSYRVHQMFWSYCLLLSELRDSNPDQATQLEAILDWKDFYAHTPMELTLKFYEISLLYPSFQKEIQQNLFDYSYLGQYKGTKRLHATRSWKKYGKDFSLENLDETQKEWMNRYHEFKHV